MFSPHFDFVTNLVILVSIVLALAAQFAIMAAAACVG